MVVFVPGVELPNVTPFQVALNQFYSGNAMVLFKAMFSSLGNSSIKFCSYSSDWVSHGLHPHIRPTGIDGPWSCAHLRVGV